MKRVRYVFGLSYLTPCEADYVGLIVMGFNHPEIAEKLGKEVLTINSVRDKVFARAHVGNRALLIGIAFRAGFKEDGNHVLVEYEGENLDLSYEL